MNIVSHKKNIPAGAMKQFSVGETEVLVINFGGKYFSLAARCTHAGAPLVEGQLNGDILTCPWHGSRFKITDGSVVRGPTHEPLMMYPVIEDSENLYIQL